MSARRSVGRAVRRRVIQAVAWVGLAFLVLPMLIAVPLSLTPKRFFSMPDGEYSLRHYENLFSNPIWLDSMAQSTLIALASAAIATVLGTLCAIGLWRLSARWSGPLRSLMLLPLIVPPIVSAVAFYRMWVDLGWIDTMLGMIVAHAILASPMVLITVSAALANFDPRLEQASRSLGASVATTVRRVILPGVRPGVLAGAVFAFILSWDEIVVAIFIARFDVLTLPRRIWDGLREGADPTVAAAAVVMIAVTLLVVAVAALARAASRAPGDRTRGNN